MKQIGHYSLSSDPKHFREIYEVVDEIVQLTGMRGRQKFMFAVCITEAFTNANLHGNCNNPEKRVELTFWSDGNRLIATVADQGCGSAADIPQTLELNQIKSDKFSGRGVAIMREFADNFEVEERICKGIQVRLEWNMEVHVPAAAPEVLDK